MSTGNIRQRNEMEELKDFRRLHKANCCLFFLHLGLLSIILCLVVLWQMQPTPGGGVSTDFKQGHKFGSAGGLEFDPET